MNTAICCTDPMIVAQLQKQNWGRLFSQVSFQMVFLGAVYCNKKRHGRMVFKCFIWNATLRSQVIFTRVYACQRTQKILLAHWPLFIVMWFATWDFLTQLCVYFDIPWVRCASVFFNNFPYGYYLLYFVKYFTNRW